MKFGTSGLRGLVAEMTDPVCGAYADGLPAAPARRGRRRRGAGRAGPAAELAAHRRRLLAGGRGPRG